MIRKPYRNMTTNEEIRMNCKHLLAAMLLIGTLTAHAQTDPPTAPLPAALAKATKLFIGNAGDQENADCLRAYNSFYDGISKLGPLHPRPRPQRSRPRPRTPLRNRPRPIRHQQRRFERRPPVPRSHRRPPLPHRPLVSHRAHQLRRPPNQSRQKPRRDNRRPRHRLQPSRRPTARCAQQQVPRQALIPHAEASPTRPPYAA